MLDTVYCVYTYVADVVHEQYAGDRVSLFDTAIKDSCNHLFQ